MTKKERALLAVDALKKEYPENLTSIDAANPLQLLIATRLAAQCTDVRVNKVTPTLFAKYTSAEDFMNADQKDVEEIIHSCGFYRIKAADLIGIGEMIHEKYNDVMPDTMEELLTLPGIGRKTANIILGDVYGKPAIVTDTHFIRLMNRLGFVKTRDPHKVEIAMVKLIPPEESNAFSHRCVLHGRAVCSARIVRCEKCVMSDFCPKVDAH